MESLIIQRKMVDMAEWDRLIESEIHRVIHLSTEDATKSHCIVKAKQTKGQYYENDQVDEVLVPRRG